MLYDSVTVVDLADPDRRSVTSTCGLASPTRRRPERRAARIPIWVAIKGDGKAYVTSQRDREIVIVDLAGTPAVTGRIPVAGLPGKMILNRSQELALRGRVQQRLGGDRRHRRRTRYVTRISTTAPADLRAKVGNVQGQQPEQPGAFAGRADAVRHQRRHELAGVIELDYGRDRGATGSVTGSDSDRLLPECGGRDRPRTRSSTALRRQRDEQHRARTRTPAATISRSRPGSSAACNAANQYSWQLTKAGFLTLPVPHRSELDQLTRQVAYNCAMERTPEQIKNARVMAAVRQPDQARHLHREGEPDLRSGVRRPAAWQRRSQPRDPVALQPEPQEAGHGLRAAGQLPRFRHGERRRLELEHRRTRDRLHPEDGVGQLRRAAASATTGKARTGTSTCLSPGWRNARRRTRRTRTTRTSCPASPTSPRPTVRRAKRAPATCGIPPSAPG